LKRKCWYSLSEFDLALLFLLLCLACRYDFFFLISLFFCCFVVNCHPADAPYSSCEPWVDDWERCMSGDEIGPCARAIQSSLERELFQFTRDDVSDIYTFCFRCFTSMYICSPPFCAIRYASLTLTLFLATRFLSNMLKYMHPYPNISPPARYANRRGLLPSIPCLLILFVLIIVIIRYRQRIHLSSVWERSGVLGS